MRKNLVVTKRCEDYLYAYEFFNFNNKTFKFHCALKQGSSPVGFNHRLCVQMLTNNGFVNIVDNRFLGVSVDNGYGYKSPCNVKKLSKVFDRFEKYVREFANLSND